MEKVTDLKTKESKKDKKESGLPKSYNANFSYNLIDELEEVNSKINQRYFGLIISDSESINGFSDELFARTSKILLDDSCAISDQTDLGKLNKIEEFLLHECTNLQKDVKKNKSTLSVILGNLDVIQKTKQFLQTISQNRESYKQFLAEQKTDVLATENNGEKSAPKPMSLLQKMELAKTLSAVQGKKEDDEFTKKVKTYKKVGKPSKDFSLHYCVFDEENEVVRYEDPEKILEKENKSLKYNKERLENFDKFSNKLLNIDVKNIYDVRDLKLELADFDNSVIGRQMSLQSSLSWLNDKIKFLESVKKPKKYDKPYLEILKQRREIVKTNLDKLKEFAIKIDGRREEIKQKLDRYSNLAKQEKWLDESGNEIDYPDKKEFAGYYYFGNYTYAVSLSVKDNKEKEEEYYLDEDGKKISKEEFENYENSEERKKEKDKYWKYITEKTEDKQMD